ncbi:acyl carrier protein [Vibrio splendidus]|nr:acyl carrier protein [Vibrio splendidus]MCC4881542.1 acyl carrier protein [Vibrio splendidus]
MNQQDIQSKVIALIADNLGIDTAEITVESNLMEDLHADSLDAVEIIMAIEEEFDIEIPDEDAETLATVQQMRDYVEKKLM